MTEELFPFCECGECGLRVTKKGNRFIFGHQRRGKKNSPEHNAANSKARTGVPLSPEHIVAIKKGIKNSDAVKAKNERQRGVPRPPEVGVKISKSKKGVPLSPEHCDSIREALTGRTLSPEHIAATIKGCEDSGAYEKQRGGNDIVNHHYIYDHSDLSKYTMKMTRSRHTQLHNVLRKLGYIVPHINVKGESA